MLLAADTHDGIGVVSEPRVLKHREGGEETER